MGNKKVVNVELDEDLWMRARSVALLEKKTISQWLAEAIELKLKEK